jgi:hypothetical protein
VLRRVPSGFLALGGTGPRLESLRRAGPYPGYSTGSDGIVQGRACLQLPLALFAQKPPRDPCRQVRRSIHGFVVEDTIHSRPHPDQAFLGPDVRSTPPISIPPAKYCRYSSLAHGAMERRELTGCRCGLCRLPVVSGRCASSCSRSESLPHSNTRPRARRRRLLKAHSNSLFGPDAGRFELGATLLANYARGLAVSNARLHDLSQSHPSPPPLTPFMLAAPITA